jgi:hypothetical protein
MQVELPTELERGTKVSNPRSVRPGNLQSCIFLKGKDLGTIATGDGVKGKTGYPRLGKYFPFCREKSSLT